MANDKYITEEEQKQQDVNEVARLQLKEDIQFMVVNASGRRMLRFILGPQVTGYFGPNGEDRGAAVALLTELQQHEPQLLEKLFASKEADENGWT